MTLYIKPIQAKALLAEIPPKSVDLILIDPPYYGIVEDAWDNQWKTENDYCDWLIDHLRLAATRLNALGSLIVFGGIGKHESHPFFSVILRVEKFLCFRNLITWKKRRAYGKSHDYLFCREEIAWFSASSERTAVTFNVPLTSEKRGYAGFNPKYPAKSEFKRVSNVWDDIPELMRPERSCQKPEPLIERLIDTHSNQGDLVVDFFSGYGTTGIVALKRNRRFIGCEVIKADAEAANERCNKAYEQRDREGE